MRGLLLVAVLAACSSEKAPARPPAPPDAAPARPTAREAIDRAAAYLAAFPAEELRYDAAIGLAAIRRRVDGEALRAAEARARAVADRDPDNPMRRVLDDGYRAEAASVTGWTAPPAGERINPNKVVVEALHCDVHGLRPETVDYATGPMRDDGGYHTTHAIWALVIAEGRGCVEPARLRPLVEELRAAQPAAPEPTARGIDLYAERLLMLLLAGERDAAVDAWAERLIDAQAADGGFGAAGPDDPPTLRYHATMLAAWALAVQAVPDEVAPAPPATLDEALARLRAAGLDGAADAIARRAAQPEPKMRLGADQALAAARAVLALPRLRALHRVMPRSTVELARAVAERDLPPEEAAAIARYLVRVVAALDFQRLATFDENHSHVTGRRWPEIDYTGEGMTWQGQQAYWAPRGVPDFRSAAAIHAYFTGAETLPHWRRVYRPRGRMADVPAPTA